MKKLVISLFIITCLAGLASADETRTVGAAGANYSTLKAAFDAINAGTVKTGVITLQIIDNTTETATAVLYQSGYGGNSEYTSIIIYPTATGKTISGNLNAPLISLDGATNVTIDGRVNQSGSTKDLTIQNTNVATASGSSTIRFINDASGNLVQYCTLKGSATAANSGVVLFSTTTGTTGNDNNSVENNNITNAADANRPLNAVYSAGTASYDNNDNNISDNNIYDFFRHGAQSYGVNIGANSTAFTISGNSFYETASFSPSASVAYYVIYINNPSGVNFNITDNYIGGQSEECGGSAWTKTNSYNNTFYGININAGSSTASSLQGNVIRNFAWSNSSNAAWYGIRIQAGDANLGTTSGNAVGDTTGTGSITVTAAATGNDFYGIYIQTTGTVVARNSMIGSITLAQVSSTNASNFYGIYKANAGTTTITYNKIGSRSTANSVNSTSGSTSNLQVVYGIYNNGTGTVTMSYDTIANLTNSTSNPTTTTRGVVNGIRSLSLAGTNEVERNYVHDLTIANANNTAGAAASVIGINVYNATLKTVARNRVWNLSNSYAGFTGGVLGIYFEGNTGANIVKENFVHSLSVTGSSPSGATIIGLRIGSGSATISNNIVTLGGNTSTIVYGFYENGGTGTTNSMFFNTAYLSGSIAAGSTDRSAAFYSNNNANTRDFRNNIFVNTRSTSGGTNLHYAAYFANTGGTITCDFNDYYVSGTGGTLGYYNGNRTRLPIVTGKDVSSLNTDPLFANAGGTETDDYIPGNNTILAKKGTGITVDYDGITRDADYPSMGAFEITIIRIVDVYKAEKGNPDRDLLAGFSTLKAAFDAINAGTVTGGLEIRINGNTTESGTATLNASGSGLALYDSVRVFPTETNITIFGNLAAPLINLNGADNVIIDGRIFATGSDRDLTLTNVSTATAAATIQFSESAETDTIKYCIIKGSGTGTGANLKGIIFLTSATVGNGNDNIVIEDNIITSDAAGRPINAIYSAGTATRENSSVIIRDNIIFDFLRHGTASNGVSIGASSSDFTVTGNSFYETTSFVPTANVAYNAILVNNATGTGFTITDNFIGGQAAECGGAAWTKTNAYNNAFVAISLTAGTGSASSVQGNTIRNFSWANSGAATWTAIYASGDVNIGTGSANTIGASTGTGSISLTGGATGTVLYGINIAGTGIVDCQNNIIGSLSTDNTGTNASNIYGINKNNAAGTTTISGNTIGSTTTASSINALSASTTNVQTVYGINSAGTGTLTISGNTIANLTNGTTNSTAATNGLINGITSSSGVNTIAGNTVRDLTIANANNAATTNASAGGIILSGATAKDVRQNIVYNISNTFSGYTGSVYGIYYAGATSGTNQLSGNFVHSLTVASDANGAIIYGLRSASGAATYANNIVTIVTNSPATIYGYYESGAASNTSNVYFNTVYIGGSPVSGALNSYAFYNSANTNTRDFRNNIFVNARSNNGATGKHYAVYLTGLTNLTINKNDYYVSGTGSVLGYSGADRATLATFAAATLQDGASLSLDPQFATAGGTTPEDYIPAATSILAATGTGITTDYAGTARSTSDPSMGAWEITINAPVDIFKSSVYQGGFSNLRDAFEALNTGRFTNGDFEIRITGNITETNSAVLNASGSGSALYSSVTVFPTVTGIIVDGSIAAPLINLNGADNVTIDGSVNATGSARDMTIVNNSAAATAGTSTIQFTGDATSNTVRYCYIKGSSTATAGGIVYFATATTTGNDGNTIGNNDITSAVDANRPLNAIYSLGTASFENSGNNVTNNNFYNFLSRGTASNGISLAANNSGWTITGNSFYETASFVPTASVAYNVITISNTGDGYTISNNFIGGQAALCGGSAWTKTNAFNNVFTAISLNSATGLVNSVQNNTIRNFNWSNSTNGNWTAISVAGGDANIGTVAANTIGSASGTGSIVLDAGTSGAVFYGISITSAGTVDCQNNITGSITTSNSLSTSATSFYGIYKSGTAGTTTISNNAIGSLVTASSVNTTSASTTANQLVYGIYSSGTATVNINGNTIANLTNGTSSTNGAYTGLIVGIASTNGTNVITNNTIRDLTIANANIANDNTASAGGIVLTGTTQRTVTGNTIYNISNSYASFAGRIHGIYFNGGTASNNLVSENFIHSISVAPTSTTAYIFGVRIVTGMTIWSNNIISISGNSSTGIFGIYETGVAGNNNSMYFNTIYLSGTLTAGSTNLSYALYSASAANTRNFRNNILINTRSTPGGSNLHYALYFQNAGGTLTCDFNDYRATGTGGVLGYYGGYRTILPVVTGQDVSSLSTDPQFANAGGTIASDYIPATSTLLGATGTGITTDYDGGDARSTTYPAMGAFEITIIRIVDVYESGDLKAGFSSLKGAFDAINAGTIKTGNIEVRINASTNENGTAVIYQSGYGGVSEYTTVTVYPTVSGVVVSGSLAAPLIRLDGASGVTIDGRVNATGTARDLVITNLSTVATAGTSTIRFINDATGNTVRYCTVRGSTTDAAGGVILFSTAAVAGNDGNTIDNNNITSAADASRPLNALYSAGSAGFENSGNNVTNNSFYDHLSRATASNGINLAANTTGWTISGNSFYETASFVPTASVAYNMILINNTSGAGFTVRGNFIGGSAASCGGSAWIKTAAANNTFTGISINTGTASPTSVQDNTIRNIDWSNSANATWTAISATGGDINIGTETGNTIGSATGTGSVTVTSATTNAPLYGIYIPSTGTINCSNNIIGSVTAANGSANASNFYGIYKTAVAGALTVSGNTIGSASTAGSISASSASTGATQSVYGIYHLGTGTATISGNHVANLSNSTTNTAGVNTGVYFNGSTAGNDVSTNFIHNLDVAAGATAATIYGIRIASGLTTYANNIISLTSSGQTVIYGIYETGAAGNNNNIYFNTIYLGGSPTGGAQNSYAIYNNANTNARNFRNNILVNARSNNGATGKHYAIYLAGLTNLTIAANDYYTPGTGGVLGYSGGDRTTLVAMQSATGQDAGSLNTNPQFASAGGSTAVSYIPSNQTLLAITGTGISTDYAAAARSVTYPSMGAYEITVVPGVLVYVSSVLQAGYSQLKPAFDAINAGAHTGAIEIRLNTSTAETASAVLNASGSGAASYTSVLLYPTLTGLSISGTLAAPLISLNGADNVTIDGRVNVTGSTRDLEITNLSTSATAGTSAIGFSNDASNNLVRYCNIRGSSAGGTSGIIIFGTTTGSTGNDDNTIDNNNITCYADASRPVNAIYSVGTAGNDNSGNIVSNNNIYNFLNRTTSSYGINLGANTTTWTISGNSFYETASFVPTVSANYNIIFINNASGTGFTISGNFIGGQSAQCGGSAWTKTNAYNSPFNAISITAGTGTASSIQNNTIRNFSWGNSTNGAWTAINAAAGDLNIGTSTGNTIGATTGTGSITVTNTSTGGLVYGINIGSSGTVDCRNNSIGSMTVTNAAANATSFYGINKTGVAGTTTINSNTIGSTTTALSINASSASTGAAQSAYGIYSAGTGSVTVSSNTIANIANGTTNTTAATAGVINGITSTNGTNTISNNIIRDLTIANANTSATNTASAGGIVLTTATAKSVTGNTIYNLSNTYSSFAGTVHGIYFTANTGANAVSENFIHSLSVASGSTAATINGIRIAAGAATWSNNIISLGGNTATTIYGLYDAGGAANAFNFYFNTIQIGGSLASGVTNMSYALYSAAASNARNIRNNILSNTRSTTSGSNLHYAIYFAATGGTLTCDYNDYYAPGTGGTPGYYGGNKTTNPVVTAQDANSQAVNPVFVNASGTTAGDYKAGANLTGITGTGITTDFGGTSRGTTVGMGAWELFRWKGTTSNVWGTASNWTNGTVPAADASIIFDASPSNNLQLDQDRSVTDIVNAQSTYNVVTNGYNLTIKGNLLFTNGARIDATASSSRVTYSGSAAQTIESGQYLSEKVYNLTIGNAAGVTLNTGFTVDNAMTINSGAIFTIAAPQILTVTGTLTNNGGNDGLVIKSSSSGSEAKLINNTSSVSGTVELSLTGGLVSPGVGRYHYFIPPVQSMTIGSTIDEVKTNLSITNFGGSLLLYDEPKGTPAKDNGWQYFDGYTYLGQPTTAFSSIGSSRGYNLYMPNNDKPVFKGSLNAAQHSFTLSYTGANPGPGWNLIGNPFPCNYDLGGVTELNNSDNVNNTVYYTVDGEFAYWNVNDNTGTTGYSDIVAPMQGFFVKVYASSTLTMPVSSKTSSAAVPSRAKGSGSVTKGNPVKKVKLALSHAGKTDQTVVTLFDDATTGFDGDHDAYKLFSSSSTRPYIYSVLENISYAINSVSKPDDEAVTIPITVVIKEAGEHTITFPELDNMNGIPVVLRHGTNEIKATAGSSYTFNSVKGTYTDFQLVLGSMSTANEEKKVEKFRIWYRNDRLFIATPADLQEGMLNITITDLQGRPVYNDIRLPAGGGQTVEYPVTLQYGLYIVSVRTGGQVFVSKVAVF